MGILSWIVLGLVAGLLARWIMPGPAAGGILVALAVGVGGALAGGLVGNVFPGAPVTGFDYRNMLFALLGTILSLIGYRSYALRLSF